MFNCQCPYCNEMIDDPDECYEPDVTYEHECPHCEKVFVFTVDYIRVYRENRAACLNGEPHNFKKTDTFPPEFARLRCSMCGEEKPLNGT